MKRLILACTLSALIPTAALAQTGQNCAPRAAVVERLMDHFGETRQSMGLGADNSVVEVFASEETGSWSIVVTMPSGYSCLVAAGQAFEELAEALPPTGKDV